jgi:hypothetical protein
VGLEFDDAAERLGGVIQEAVQRTPPAQEWTRRDLPAFPDALAPEVGAALRDWLAELHVEVEAGEEVGARCLSCFHACYPTCRRPGCIAPCRQRPPRGCLTPGPPARPLRAPQATPAALRRARAVLESQVLPAAAWQESHPGEALTPGALLEGVPLGFSTGDAAVDVGAKALRMLHVAGLRRLQAAADEGLERMQALTANPRTDTGHTGKGRA